MRVQLAAMRCLDGNVVIGVGFINALQASCLRCVRCVWVSSERRWYGEFECEGGMRGLRGVQVRGGRARRYVWYSFYKRISKSGCVKCCALQGGSHVGGRATVIACALIVALWEVERVASCFEK